MFSDVDRRALTRVRNGLIVNDRGSGMMQVGPVSGFAGSIGLPSGRHLVITPKAGANRVPDLLSLAYATLAPPASIGSTSAMDASASDWLSVQLAAEVEELLNRGLRRSYVERREELAYVRGRIHPPLNPARLPSLECSFADFSLDTPENRLLRGALEYLIPGVINAEVRRKLRDALAHFQAVPLTQPSLRAFSSMVVNRLNEHYRPSLRLARLALEGAGLSDSVIGDISPAYLVQMWRIWELAVAEALRHTGSKLRVAEQPVYGDRFIHAQGAPDIPVSIVPDIVIGDRLRPAHVVDVKWRSATVLRHKKRRLRNDNLYQLATYCKAFSCDGTLLYPLMDGCSVQSTYILGASKIHVRTVDLEQENLRDLRDAANEIMARADA